MVNTIKKRFLRIFVGAFFLLIGLVSLGQPMLKFEDKVQKFPKTIEGEQLTFDYHFTNSGNAPLIINEIKVSCSCTKFDFPKEPISAGTRGVIHVTFDTAHKIGYQDRTLVICSNAKSSEYSIRFKGMVDNKSNK
jgi:hypothetical protein